MTQNIELTRKDGKNLSIPYDVWAEEAQKARDEGYTEDQVDEMLGDAESWGDEYLVVERDEEYEAEVKQPTWGGKRQGAGPRVQVWTPERTAAALAKIQEHLPEMSLSEFLASDWKQWEDTEYMVRHAFTAMHGLPVIIVTEFARPWISESYRNWEEVLQKLGERNGQISPA